jgi:hypothetical protein
LGDSGDVTIFVNGEVIYCPPKGECQVLRKKQDNKFGQSTRTPNRQAPTTSPSN